MSGSDHHVASGRRPIDAAPPPRSEPTPHHRITVTVNGEAVRAEVESRLLLTDFLRHRLRLTGTHVGCEQGACGACTIHLDGRAVRSCLLLAVQADGANITTIEGLTEHGDDRGTGQSDLGPIQQAFADQHGLQCGFCTPGFVMTLAAVADRGGPASEADVDECVGSSYCRCTGYVNIRRAARQALGLAPDPETDTGTHANLAPDAGLAPDTGRAPDTGLAPDPESTDDG